MKRFLSILLAVVMIISVATPVFAYTDTEKSDYGAAIECLSGLNIVNGYEDGSFKPEKVVTRAEMAKLLVVALGLDMGASLLTTATSYDDVTTEHWAIGYINVATQYGLIKGDGNGKFRPDDTVNYAEACTMCLRALGYNRVVDKAGQWPTNYLNKANELKLFEDVEKFTANNGANRGSIAQIMWNMLNQKMWDVSEESENDGLVYTNKDAKTMLEAKFDGYSFEKYTFDNWDISSDDDEYVVEVSLESVEANVDNFKGEYAKNDFYTFVKGTEVKALTFENSNRKEIVNIYVTDDNYLANGYSDELSDKYDNVTNDNSFKYLRLNSSKSSATIANKIEIPFANNQVIREIKENKTNTKIKLDKMDGRTNTITVDKDIFEQDAFVLLNGERTQLLKLTEGTIINEISNGATTPSTMYLAVKNVGEGTFDGLKEVQDKEETNQILTISDKEYVLAGNPIFVEVEDDNENAIDKSELTKKVKDNDYLDCKVTIYFDMFGKVTKVVFGEVNKVEKTLSLYISADGDLRKVVGKEDTKYYVNLGNKDKVESFEIEEEYAKELTAAEIIEGAVYYVEFDSNNCIEKMEMVSELVDGDNNAPINSTIDTNGLIDNRIKFKTGTGSIYTNNSKSFAEGDFKAYVINTELDDDNYVKHINADNVTHKFKITADTEVYTIRENEDKDGNLNGEYSVEYSKGKEKVEGIDDLIVVADPNEVTAKFAIVIGNPDSDNKNVGIVEKIRKENGINYATINGQEDELDKDVNTSIIGDVVAYTINDKKIEATSIYDVDGLVSANEVIKVNNEIITIENEDEKLDLDKAKNDFEDNDIRVFILNVEENDDEFEFESIEEIKIDDMKLSVGDFVELVANKYYFIIKGYSKTTIEGTELTVTAPVIGENPQSEIEETTEYTATISWAGELTAEDKFKAGVEYTATITITPKDGYTLVGIKENEFTVEGADEVTNDANSGIITASYKQLIVSNSNS